MGSSVKLEVGKVGIYSRVSTLDQNRDEDGSIRYQINRGIEFCEEYGFEYEIYNENVGSSLSGSDVREELDRLIRDIKKGKLKYVWCLGLDRLFRNPEVSFVFKEILLDNDCRLLVNGELWDFDNIGVELRYGIEQIIQKRYVLDLQNRASNAMWIKWKKGEFVYGKPPFGLKWNKEKEVLELDDEKIEKIKVLFAIIRGGEYNLSNIVDGLEFRGYKLTYSWLSKFFIDRKVSEWMYLGYLERSVKNKEGEIHTNRFNVERCLFSEEDYNEVFKCMKSKKRNNINHSSKSDLDRTTFGYGFYRCGCCGRKLYSISRGKTNYRNVYCKNSVENKNNSLNEVSRLLMKGMIKCEQKGYFRLEKLESYLWYSIERSIGKSKNYELDVLDKNVDTNIKEIEELEKSLERNKDSLRKVEIKIERLDKSVLDRELDFEDMVRVREIYLDDCWKLERIIKDEENILRDLKKDNNNRSRNDIIEEFVKLDISKLNSISRKKEFMMKYVQEVEVRWDKEGKCVMKIIFKKPILDYRYLKKGESVVKLNGRIDKDKLITKYHSFKKNWEMGLN